MPVSMSDQIALYDLTPAKPIFLTLDVIDPIYNLIFRCWLLSIKSGWKQANGKWQII